MATQTPSKFDAFKTQIVESRSKIIVPFILFAVASVAFAALTPVFVGISGGRPALWQIASTGIVIIILSSLFIALVSRILNLRALWALLMALFLACVAIIKFIFVPQSIYGQEIHIEQSLLSTNFDPNKWTGYIFLSAAIFLMYMVVLGIYYLVYRRKVFEATNLIAKRSSQQVKATQKKWAKKLGIFAIVVVVLVGVLIAAGATYLLFIPLIFVGTPLQYLTIILNNGGAALVILLVLAVIFAFRSVQVSADQAIDTRKPAIIAICFWIALSVLLLYQIIWVVYMTVLVTLAPFKVIYFSSK